MSNIYNLEPPTKGKVSLKTTLGDIDIELWPKEAPKAVRNFVQLALEGYYDGCIFHRIIKDYIAQTGDPTGTGMGGETIYGAPFRDEFHSRLRFTHRGLIACANANEKNTNGTQFFITLDKCDYLNNKNTIFGKVVGDTIYNTLRLNDVEVDEDDRPVDPPLIKSIEVLWNPFDDIVPRTTPQERQAQEQFKRAEEGRKERKSRKRNLALLSFGEQAEEEEQDLKAAGTAAKIRSAHEVLRGDTKLLAPEETPEEVIRERQQRAKDLAAVQDKLKGAAAGRSSRGAGSSSDDSDSDSDRDRDRKRRRGSAPGAAAGAKKSAGAVIAERVKAAADKAERANAGREGREAAVAAAAADRAASAAAAGEGEGKRARNTSRSRSRSSSQERPGAVPEAAVAAAGGSSKGDGLYELKEKTGAGRMRVTDDVADGELLKSFELSRQKYKKRKEQVGNRQKDTLSKLQAFQQKLRNSTQKQQQQQDKAAAATKAAQEAAAVQQQEAAEAAAAAASKQEAANGSGDKAAGGADEAYDGKVRKDIDHRTYMPAAWRVDEYLNQEEDEDDFDLSTLKQHKLEWSKAPGDAMARRDDLDDYEVYDPLLEAAKGKFSRAAQREKKKQTNWAGKGHG